MRPRKILTVFGTRPEVIKLAPVVRRLAADPARFVSRLCATAQHREMLDQALAPFAIIPDDDLDIMRPDQALPDLTARAVTALSDVIRTFDPNILLVQGDTTTAFCGALAAFYHGVTVGHVEAGLRTGQKYAPFPEEMNRRLISRVADLHFAPTERARGALVGEGVDPASVFVTGNTVVDALLWMRTKVADAPPALSETLGRWMADREVVMVTGHRRESVGGGLENVCLAIREVAEVRPHAAFVYPVHLNPRVREPVERLLGDHTRVRLIAPLAYDEFVWLMTRAAVILTDSGGVQEEAPVLGKPVLVTREHTERMEGVADGHAELVGLDRARIVASLLRLLDDPAGRAAMSRTASPYGDGHAAERIVDILAG